MPADSCTEIKASEGEDAVSGIYWFDSMKPGEVVLARCDMSKLGKSTFVIVPRFSTSAFSYEPTLSAEIYVKFEALSMIRVSVFPKVSNSCNECSLGA